MAATPVWALQSQVRIVAGADSARREVVSQRLTEVLARLETGKWGEVKGDFTPDGLKSITVLADQTHLLNVNPLYESNLIELPSGGYEVRDLKVVVDTKGVAGNPYQYLVFTLDERGLISDVRFALERQQYAGIIQSGLTESDIACRQQILQFVEEFRTAYSRKDLDYLKKVYSDDALIIVGRVLKPKQGEIDYLEKSSLSHDRIQFIRESKQEYISRLGKVFANNESIKVGFAEVNVRRHPKFEKIYGVTLQQNWKSSSYSDTGWLFLMIDFRNPSEPLIHVRSWQPQKFADGSVVSLGDFEIIE